MSFIQVIEHTTSKIDEIRALAEDFRKNRPEGTGPIRSTVTADRDRPGRYFVIVEFESYESAMKNSEDPATQEFAEKMAALVDAPPVFYNLDVIEQQSF